MAGEIQLMENKQKILIQIATFRFHSFIQLTKNLNTPFDYQNFEIDKQLL